jgi:septal ring factor EnvC (AmiA/AmiB activator)
MADEDFEKKMESIVEQQAQLAVNHEKANERLTRLENLVARFAQATVERFEATDKQIAELDEKFSALVDAQMRTEESIRNLTAVVDRYFSEGRNGKPEA